MCYLKILLKKVLRLFPVALFSLPILQSFLSLATFCPFMRINTTRSFPEPPESSETERNEIVPMSDCYGNIHQIHPKYSPRLENWEKRDLPIRLMFGNVQWSVKKMRLFFAFFPFIVTSAPALNISNFSSDVPSQKQLSSSHTHSALRLQSLLFFDDTIKTMGYSEEMKKAVSWLGVREVKSRKLSPKRLGRAREVCSRFLCFLSWSLAI